MDDPTPPRPAAQGYTDMSKHKLVIFLLSTAAVGFAGGFGAWWGSRLRTIRPASPRDDWNIPQLVLHLHARGVHLRVVPVIKNGPVGHSAYLTEEDDRKWEELNLLMASPEYLGKWRGVVLCEEYGRGRPDPAHVAAWGRGCTELRPFLLFGDPALRSRIDEALRSDGPEGGMPVIVAADAAPPAAADGSSPAP
jgi:hypothetical protein